MAINLGPVAQRPIGLQQPALVHLSNSLASSHPYHNLNQPFCNDREGWGPLSPYRYDFTPCFIDVWIAIVAVLGLVFGGAAIVWLLRTKTPAPKTKDVRFWIKQTLLGVTIADFVIQFGFLIYTVANTWYSDFRVWTAALAAVSLAVIFAIQWLEYSRLRNANAIALLYWLFMLIALGVKLRSLIERQIYTTGLPYFCTYSAGVAISAIVFLLECLQPQSNQDYDALVDDEDDPEAYANIFSRMSFSWMTPMMQRGYKVFLTQDDLWALSKNNTSNACGDAFEKAWNRNPDRSKRPSLWLTLARAYGSQFMLAAVFKVGNDISQYLQPQLLRYLITFIESYNTHEVEPISKGATIALAMFACALAQTFMIHHYFQLGFAAGMRIKGGLSSAIYRKSLRLSNEGRSTKTTGDIVNYMAVDSQRLQDLTQWGHQLWSAPFQIAICMFSLYQLVGWSMLAGIAVMVISMPCQGLISILMRRLQKKQMKNKDERSRLITEIINNMKSIKLYAWGSAFMNKLNFVRNEKELKTLRMIGATQALANFTWTTAPFFVSCSTFTVYVLTNDKPLTTDIVFPALALFNLLTFPLAVLPLVISAIVEASVAAGRISDFLVADEIQDDAVILGPTPTQHGEESVIVENASFSYNRHEKKNVLEKIYFRAYKGELSCIVGRVGAGKSSLLQSILGDIWKVQGSVHVNGTVAYVAQQPWILNATVKENIIFGHRLDPDFYEQTVKGCALVDDFSVLPDGDLTVVGERGISLSGGQKARVALARAVYARADIYLLDDVLSAVDSHVGQHIIDNILGPRGLLASKTRILATNSLIVLKEGSYITMLRDGEIAEQGTFDELMAARSGVFELIKTGGQGQGSGTPPTSETSTVIGEVNVAGQNDGLEEAGETVSDLVSTSAGPSHSSTQKSRSGSITTLRRASAATFRGPRGKLTDDEVAGTRTQQKKEHLEQGKVKWDVYLEYAKYNQLSAVAVYLFTLIASQSATIGGSVWLKTWAEANEQTGTNGDVGKYIGVYFAFGIGSALLAMIQTLILWIFCSIEASRKLHEKMATAIFRSPMSFFDTTPTGRILNRFSSDIYRVDEILARTFNVLFSNLARSGFTLIVISVASPPFITLILPLGFMYYSIQRYYLRTSRELRRLDSASKSPIFAHFQESLGGLSTIKAYKQQERFMLENAWRVDANLRAYYPSISANRWLGIRLEFIGAIVILAAASLPVITLALGGKLSAGLVGLAMSYGLQITASLNWIVRQSVDVESNIVAVERVLEYARLPSEAPEIIPNSRPSIAWPAEGTISFRNYSTRYRENLDLVLKNINLDIRPHEKIGVVGRTGAGKSSLTLALFRIIEPCSGKIEIDSVNTSSIGLLDLRRRLAIIPQDAALFEGTIRDNLDPGHTREDTELWAVLEHARLRDHVISMEGGLEAKINEGGSNLSQGQRQLVSLARAMLTPSTILVLDEATASVDVETDAHVQATLRSALFAHRTILTIAHRINTIMDSDRVVVLDKGEVAEFDTPAKLLARRGIFYSLVKQAGLDVDTAEEGGRSSP